MTATSMPRVAAAVVPVALLGAILSLVHPSLCASGRSGAFIGVSPSRVPCMTKHAGAGPLKGVSWYMAKRMGAMGHMG